MKRRGFFQSLAAAWFGVQVVEKSNVINEITTTPANSICTYGWLPESYYYTSWTQAELEDAGVTTMHNERI